MARIFLLLPVLLCMAAGQQAYPEVWVDSENLLYGGMAQLPELRSGILDVDPAFFSKPDAKRYLVFGQGSMPNHTAHGMDGFFSVTMLSESEASDLASRGYHIMEDYMLDFHNDTRQDTSQDTGQDTSQDTGQDASRVATIAGSDTAQEFGYTGKGTRVAIVDTGVDFSNPDLKDSLARDEANHPMMLDPDGQGIILTNATFYASIDENGFIQNYTGELPTNMTSKAYVNRDGVFLDLEQGGDGTSIPIYNSFYPQVGLSAVFNGTLESDMKIGQDNRDYIRSQSGVYHLGVMYQGDLSGLFTGLQVVPVLLVDSHEAGLYDTIIPDMSTSYKDYTRDDAEEPDYDFDFTDEKPIILGSGQEFLVYDSDGDGMPDYSAGTAGAHTLDVYGVISGDELELDDALQAVNGTLLEPIDPEGNYFGVMTDFVSHGTASAGTIASAGLHQYDIYNDTKKYVLPGVAPDAKIIPVKALWFGDAIYGWLWAAGFENQGHGWEFTGEPRADIISNSWGVSTFPALGATPGMDPLSLVMAALSTPGSIHDDYPGVIMVSSAGNSGHGYGTIGLPNSSPYGISVGATTNNVFVGYGPFAGEPRFGNSTTHHGHMADFTSRGPSTIGDPKPDLAAVGAHGFVPTSVLAATLGQEPFRMYGGTSMAAPIVSGAAAILIEAMRDRNMEYDPFLVKNVLMSSAGDLGNDPFTQGAGLADVGAALHTINGSGGFVIYNDASYRNIRDVLKPALGLVNATDIGFERFGLPPKPHPITGWFAGQLEPGGRSTATFTVENLSSEPLKVSVMPEQLVMVSQTTYQGETRLHEQDAVLNMTGIYAPNYIRLADVIQPESTADFFRDVNPVPEDADLMVLNLNFPFEMFLNGTADMYGDDLQIASLYLYDWVDSDGDDTVTSGELAMVNRAGSWGTVQELRTSNPAGTFEGVPLVGVYPVPEKFSYWLGETGTNSTAIEYELTASYYSKQRWPVLWPESDTLAVPAGGSADMDVTLVLPVDLATGVYQGFLAFEGGGHSANAPVSFVSKVPVSGIDTVIVSDGRPSHDIMYGNGYTKGAFDMASRYMAGDWRQYYFDVQDTGINSAAVELSWEDEDTNLSVFVADPAGRIVQSNFPAGIFGEFLGWASADWLGNSPFSQGGGFYPVKNRDETSTVLYVPINQTGTYTVMAHTTLFGGGGTTEPVEVVARFADVSAGAQPAILAARGMVGLGGTTASAAADTAGGTAASTAPSMVEDTAAGTPQSMDVDTAAGPADGTAQDTAASVGAAVAGGTISQAGANNLSDTPDGFALGVMLGLAAGAAIGFAVMLILRQNPAPKSTSSPPKLSCRPPP